MLRLSERLALQIFHHRELIEWLRYLKWLDINFKQKGFAKLFKLLTEKQEEFGNFP